MATTFSKGQRRPCKTGGFCNTVGFPLLIDFVHLNQVFIGKQVLLLNHDDITPQASRLLKENAVHATSLLSDN